MVELAVSLFQDVGVTTILDTIIHVDGVIDIEVNPATHVDAQVEVLIREGIVPTQDQLRRVVAHELLVVLCLLVGRDYLAILVVEQEVAIVVEAGELPNVERTNR